jgi:hypothetical protein
METNTTSRFRNACALLKGIVNTFNRVILHGDKEARRELRTGGSGVEKSRRSMSKPTLRKQVVGLNSRFDIVFVDTNSDTHKHVLRTFYYTAVNAEEVRALESFETKVVVIKITIIDDFRVETFLVVHDNLEDVFSDQGSGILGLGVDVAAHDLDAAEKLELKF